MSSPGSDDERPQGGWGAAGIAEIRLIAAQGDKTHRKAGDISVQDIGHYRMNIKGKIDTVKILGGWGGEIARGEKTPKK